MSKYLRRINTNIFVFLLWATQKITNKDNKALGCLLDNRVLCYEKIMHWIINVIVRNS